jgi:hypothetical protein
MSRLGPLLGFMLVLGGCSSPYNVRLSDDKSASFGPLFFFGWADPPLVPGTRLVDAAPGSRVVLWNEAGLEVIVDVGDACSVLVREGDGARAPTDLEMRVVAAVFPAWPLAPSTGIADYAGERRLERRFPSHIRAHVESLDPEAVVTFALGDAPPAWMALGGRAFALSRAAAKARPRDFAAILDRAVSLEGDARVVVLRPLLARPEITPAELRVVAAAGEIDLAVSHAAADESVCLAAIEAVRLRPFSLRRRRGLEAILDSPGATARVREEALKVPLAYPEDREAVRIKAAN